MSSLRLLKISLTEKVNNLKLYFDHDKFRHGTCAKQYKIIKEITGAPEDDSGALVSVVAVIWKLAVGVLAGSSRLFFSSSAIIKFRRHNYTFALFT